VAGLRCTEADFVEYRRQRAFTAWKYAMHDVGLPLPTQSATGQARCFCARRSISRPWTNMFTKCI
jgi:hypothetical protein